MKKNWDAAHSSNSDTAVISSNPLRLYFGLAVSIAAMLLYRSALSDEWQADVIISAGFADMAVLAIFAGAYLLAEHYLPEMARGYHRLFHYLLIFLLILSIIASQTLFTKTGEYLDIHIVSFVIENFDDVVGAVKSETDWVLLENTIHVLIYLFLASLQLKKGLLKNLTRFVLVLPIVLLASCKLFIEEDTVLRVEGAQPTEGAFVHEGLRQLGRQKVTEHTTPLLGYWNRGILTGLYFGARFGEVMFAQLTSKAEYDKDFYVRPEYLGVSGQMPNIVLIILESIRYDALGVYGGKADSGESNTPYIDQLAKNGILVDRAYTTVQHTSKALVGIYCGMLPILKVEITEAEPGGMPYTCLPELLNKAGYQTGHFQTAPARFENRIGLVKNSGFQYHFTQEDVTGDWQKYAYLSMDDMAMVKPAIAWMQDKKRKGQPFMTSMLTVVTHHPYLSPRNSTYAKSIAEAHQNYLDGVKYTDVLVREIIESMKREGLDDNTIVIITGDHGEAFGEHGKVMHNGVAYEEGVRVPLIIYAPDRYPHGDVVQGLRQHIDIMPTILEIVGMEFKGKLPGRNLLADVDGHNSILTSCFYTNYCLTLHKADGEKISFYYGKRKTEIFRVDVDPQEQENLRDYVDDEYVSRLLMMAASLKKSYQHAIVPNM